jgi:hypothetical protein
MLGRAVACPGTVFVGILGLGDAVKEPVGGREGKFSGEERGGVGTPSVGIGEL